ncbi:MAG: iron chaperone [Bacteroidota bacterium]
MTVDQYLDTLPSAQRESLQRLRSKIQLLLPQAEEIISYGMPAFKQNGILVYYAAFTHHMSLFVMPKVLDQVRPMLGDRSTTKSAIHFNENNPIPRTIVAQCIALRLAEIEAKLMAKKLNKLPKQT